MTTTLATEDIFQERFMRLYYNNYKPQQQFATELGVSRASVSGWLSGKTKKIEINSLTKIAQHFGVSTDYLLGLSDTASPDVTLSAAAKYTGLTEAATTRLHLGIDTFTCDGVGASSEEKRKYLRIASILIQSDIFSDLIHHLCEIENEAYFETVLRILFDQYCNDDSPEEDTDFHFTNKSDRDVVTTQLIHIFEKKAPHLKESIPERVHAMNDDDLANDVLQALMSARESNELHQFHAAKKFNRCIDQLIKLSKKEAQKLFESEHVRSK